MHSTLFSIDYQFHRPLKIAMNVDMNDLLHQDLQDFRLYIKAVTFLGRTSIENFKKPKVSKFVVP